MWPTPMGRLRRAAALLALLSGILASSSVAAENKPLTENELKQLFTMLETSPHYKARLKAARALGMLRRPEAISHLVGCLKQDQDHAVRSGCAWALGSISHPGAVRELAAATGSEITLVKTQAERALNYILSDFPGNLPANARYRIQIDGLADRVNRNRELTKWIQQYFLDLLMQTPDRIDVGTDMDIEEDGERPDVQREFEPVVELTFRGGVTGITSPKDRKPGEVRVVVELEVLLEPVGAKAVPKKSLTGSASFAGGAKPKDDWTDDPLLESHKAALKKGVGGLFPEVKKVLKL
ncbi:MAG: HEAT repeat domain-containing protein [Deltaproteobacteria bacterium]|nr:HEAT repeat domain-containing protein [Deltaproteobacteria bacterium]